MALVHNIPPRDVPAAASRERSIPLSMGHLSGLVSRIGERATRLRDRIMPVLRSTPKAATEPSPTVPHGDCDVARSINAEISRLESIDRDLDELCDLIEL
jgi:hypothetical protein